MLIKNFNINNFNNNNNEKFTNLISDYISSKIASFIFLLKCHQMSRDLSGIADPQRGSRIRSDP